MMSLCLRQGTPTTAVLVGFVQSVQMRYKSWLSWPRRVRYAIRLTRPGERHGSYDPSWFVASMVYDVYCQTDKTGSQSSV